MLNEQQKVAATRHGRPSFIMAGAGTGKTFTLSNRVAFEFDARNAGELPGGRCVEPEELMAITFTEAAASELVSRIRAASKGASPERSRRIEAAWVSTIHSMCRRIVVENAFSVGCDPGVAVMSEEDEAELLSQSAAEAAEAAGVADIVDPGFLASALKKALSVPGGVSGLEFGPQVPYSESDVYDDRIAYIDAYVRAVEEAGEVKDAERKRVCARAAELREMLAGFRDSGTPLDEAELAFAAMKGVTGKSVGWTQANGRITAKLSGAARKRATLAMLPGLLPKAAELFGEKLSRSASTTFDMLLQTASDILSDDDTAREMSARFSSIMVDEFQDTDAVQAGIVSRLCSAPDGQPDYSKLITVGDRQQSIYGFRGADVHVSDDMGGEMDSQSPDGAAAIPLTENYRSDAAILSFVEDVFSSPSFFGDSFLSLSAARTPGPADGPARVELVRALRPPGIKSPSEDMLLAEARAVARRFRELRESGMYDYGQMAILLRSLNGAETFMQALAEQGVPSAIANGRKFFSFEEVSAVLRGLEGVLSPDDDSAVFRSLTSGMFAVPDAELAELKCRWRERRAGGDAATLSHMFADGGFDGLPAACEAMRALSRCSGMLDDGLKANTVLAELLGASGYRDTVMADKMAGAGKWANVRKLMDVAEKAEDSAGTVARHAITRLVEMGRAAMGNSPADRSEKPGMMLGDAQRVSIMTMHASKGLEFDVVAVSASKGDYPIPELSVVRVGNGHFVAGSVDADPLVAVMGLSPDDGERPGEDDIRTARRHGEFAALVNKARAIDEKAESKRLLYVALTRAREHLIYAGRVMLNKDGSASANSDELFADVWNLAAAGAEGPKALISHPGYDVSAITVEMTGTEEHPPAPDCVPFSHGHVSKGVPPHVKRGLGTSAKPLSFSSLKAMEAGPASATYLVQDSVAAPGRGSDSAMDEAQESAAVDGDRRDGKDFGTAWHRLACIAEARGGTMPSDGEIADMARECALAAGEAGRLADTLSGWLASDTRREILRRGGKWWCEIPAGTMIRTAGGERELRGIMDLVVESEDGESAFVWDYKTGWIGAGIDEIAGCYSKQMEIYAYMLLKSRRYSKVSAGLVLVEREYEKVSGRWEYSADDLPRLEQGISDWVGRIAYISQRAER